MPLYFEKKDSIFIFRTVGDVNYEEGLAIFYGGLESIKSSPEKNKLILFDLLLSTENRKPEEVKALANIVKKNIDRGKLALLAKSSLHFGYSRMFSVLAEKDTVEISVFKELNEALHWLLLPSDAE